MVQRSYVVQIGAIAVFAQELHAALEGRADRTG